MILTDAQYNAVRAVAGRVIADYDNLPKKKRKDDDIKREIINKHFKLLKGVISRPMFLHALADESGVNDERID